MSLRPSLSALLLLLLLPCNCTALSITAPFLAVWGAFGVFKVVTFAKDVVQLTWNVVSKGDGAACSLCDKIMVILLSGETEGGGFTDVDCNSLCWRFDKCKVMCGKIVNALTHSTKFPCVAAGYCPQMDDFGALPRCKFRFPSSCEPANICTFKFPRCQLSEGYKKWRQIDAMMKGNIGAIGNALAQAPKCGEAGSHPLFCVNDPTGFGLWCYRTSFVVVTWASIQSVLAIESPGGDDDRQWLSFWIIYVIMQCCERISDVFLSWIPQYYEFKLAFLIYLVFFEGADRLYRSVHQLFKNGFKIAVKLGYLAHRHMEDWDEEDYLETLHPELATKIREMGGVNDAFSGLSGGESCLDTKFGPLNATRLKKEFLKVAPRWLQVSLIQGQDLASCVDGSSDPFVIFYLVPPAPLIEGGGATKEIEGKTPTASYASSPTKKGGIGSMMRLAHSLSLTHLTKHLAALSGSSRGSSFKSQSSGAAVDKESALASKDAAEGQESPSVASSSMIRASGQVEVELKGGNKKEGGMVAGEEGGGGGEEMMKKHNGHHPPGLMLEKTDTAATIPHATLAESQAPSSNSLVNSPLGRNLGTCSPTGRSRGRGRGPAGAAGQYAQQNSKCVAKNLDPEWHEEFELYLKGGHIDDKGVYQNKWGPYHQLRVEVWDQVGLQMTRNNFMGEATIDLGPLMASRSMETWFQLEDPSGVAECSVTGAVKLKLRWNDDAMPIESSVSQFELFARRCRREEARLEGAFKDRLNAFKDGMQSSRSSQGRSSFSQAGNSIFSSMTRMCSPLSVSSEDSHEDLGSGKSRLTTPKAAVGGLIKRLSRRGSKLLGMGDDEHERMRSWREENVASRPGNAESERLARVESAGADERTEETEMEM